MKKKNTTPLEAWEQEQIFSWIRANQIRYPKLQLAYSTLNGVRLGPKTRMEAKRQGNRKGVTDIVLPFKDHGKKYSGFYLELKRRQGGVVSKEQKSFMAGVEVEGFRTGVAKGWNEAVNEIKNYMGI
jgi:VRR-NUC domain